MNPKVKRITATVLAVIFLVGVLPYSLTKVFRTNSKKEGQQVRVALFNGQVRNIPLEEYLIGVVAAEMPAEFDIEALKAQAVAARTYALKRMGENTANTSDVDTTEKTQAWNSNRELYRRWGLVNYINYYRKIVKAVEETEGKIITYNGQKIDAVYHSSSGRKGTERATDVWGLGTNYLTNVPSGEATPLRFVKHQIFDVHTFYKLLGFSKLPTQFKENDIIILERTKGGRVKTLAIKDQIFPGTDVRAKLQLPSTDFEWKIRNMEIELIIYGKGHGVGMSQYGANDLAQAGQTYSQILAHFYPDTKIEKVY